MHVQLSLDHLVLDGLDASYRARLLRALEQQLAHRFAGGTTLTGDVHLDGHRFEIDPARPPEQVAQQLAGELHFSAHVHAASVGRLAPGGLRAASQPPSALVAPVAPAHGGTP